MKAPQVTTLADAYRLAEAINACARDGRWSKAFVHALLNDGLSEFQRVVDRDWNEVWSNEECAAIAVAYRLTGE